MDKGFGSQHPLLLVNSLLIAFGSGIFLAAKISVPLWPLYILIFLVMVDLMLGIAVKKLCLAYGLIFLFFLLGMMRLLHSAALPADDISLLRGKNLTITGRVVESPVVKSSDGGMTAIKYIVKIDQARQNSQVIPASGQVIVYTKERAAAPVARYGDKIKVSGEVRSIHGYGNPGLIDSEAALKRQGITAKIFAAKSSVQVSEENKWFFQRFIDRLRADLLAAMKKVMPEGDAAGLFAMLFGGYGGIKPELLEAFTATGIVHILSVSGSHIALLAGTLEQIGRFLRFKPTFTAIGIVVVILFYGAFSGFAAPVVRSSIMGILVFGAMVFGREKDGRRILSIAGLGMLIYNPQLIFDISFQLSFGATAGLLYLAPQLQGLFKFLPKWLAANISLTIAAQVSVLPFLAWYFNALSLSSLIANIVAVPLVEYIIIIGLIGAIIGGIVPVLQNILFVVCSLSLGLVYNITKAVAAVPGGNIDLPSGGMVAGLLYYLVLTMWIWQFAAMRDFLKLHFSGGKKYAFIGLSISLAVLVWQIGGSQPVKVHFIDVGQGDAALITTPAGKAVLIDTGGVLQDKSDFDIGARVVVPYLKHYGVKEIEYLILTHAHEDHAGGAKAVVRKIKVHHVITGREDRQAYAKVFKTSLERMPKCIPAYQGQQFTVDGVGFAVVAAQDSIKHKTGNETSAVIKVKYGAHSFLITGDLTAEGETMLLNNEAPIETSVLKVGHHGSKTSSTEEFIQKVRPQYAIISVGADNAFGHPDGAVVERLKENGASLYRTDEDGAVVFTSDGKKLKVDTFRQK